MSHRCPRPGCDALVPDYRYACRGDWFALPKDIRDRIWIGYRGGDPVAHASAMSEARAWYRANTPGVPS